VNVPALADDWHPAISVGLLVGLLAWQTLQPYFGLFAGGREGWVKRGRHGLINRAIGPINALMIALPPIQKERLRFLHGSLIYGDQRLADFDAAAVVEVIEHLDAARLSAFESVLVESAKPKSIAITTPNREYNLKWETLPAGKFRHRDHRFEWTRAEFQNWANGVAACFGYNVRFLPVGPEDLAVGSPTQMGIFERSA